MCGQIVAQGSWWEEDSDLFESVGVKENPSKLNDLGRVLGNVDTVFITGGRNMDHDVAVDVELGHLLRRHGGGGFAGSGQVDVCEMRARASTLQRWLGSTAMDGLVVAVVVVREGRALREASLCPPSRLIKCRRESGGLFWPSATRLQEAVPR